MKIIQVNAWLGYLMYPLLEFLEKENADIVCLQEILSNNTPNPLFESFGIRAKLAALFSHHYFSPTYTFPAFGVQIETGSMILSKHPLEHTQTFFTYGEFTKSQTLDSNIIKIRNAQFCVVTLPGSKKLNIVNHHGYHDVNPSGTPQSMVSMQKLIDHIKTLQGSVVLCGDLNLQPNSKPIKELEKHLELKNLTAEYAIPTTLSSVFRVKNIQVPADYIMVSPDITVRSFTASDFVVSDHKALIAEVSL